MNEKKTEDLRLLDEILRRIPGLLSDFHLLRTIIPKLFSNHRTAFPERMKPPDHTLYIYRYAIEKARRRFTKHNPQFLYGNEVSSILRWLTSFPSPTPSRLRWCNRSQKTVCKKGGKLGEYARKRRVLKVFSFLKKERESLV